MCSANLLSAAIAMAVIATALTGLRRQARRAVVDWAGVALFAAGVSALLLGIVEAGRAGSWSRIDVVALLVLGGIGLVAFVAVERRAGDPLVPPRPFQRRMILAAGRTPGLLGPRAFGRLASVLPVPQPVSGAPA